VLAGTTILRAGLSALGSTLRPVTVRARLWQGMKRTPWLPISLLVALVAVIGLSVLVGFVGAPDDERFDWDLASVFGTALGTTLLAVATAALAWSTRVDVRATQELATLTKRDQDERERPVVILEYVGVAYNGPTLRPNGVISFGLRNVGLGPALRVAVNATYSDSRYPVTVTTEIIPAIAPGEISPQRNLNFDWKETPPPDEEFQPGGFPITGDYRDRSQRHTYPIITDWDAPVGG
jgi:hypothetical protein